MHLIVPLLLSCLLALGLAQILGVTLGLLAIRFRALGHFSNLLTELRGSLGLSALCVVAIGADILDPPIAIGMSAGISQAIAIARWMTRPSGSWAPEELGALAIGESSAHLALVRGYRRGAVRATGSLGVLHCLALWAIVLEIFPSSGASLESIGPWLLAVTLALLFVGNELVSTRFSNRRTP